MQVKTCTDNDFIKSEKAYWKILSIRKAFSIITLTKYDLYLIYSTNFVTADL